MDFTASLNQIVALSIQARIRLVQAILESIAAEQVHPDLTEFQKQELDRRINDSEANPENVLTWEEVKASVKARK
jgi:putative addiction module component, TIGR02574 family